MSIIIDESTKIKTFGLPVFIKKTRQKLFKNQIIIKLIVKTITNSQTTGFLYFERNKNTFKKRLY